MIIQSVSRETLDALEHLQALVQKWSPKINLVSRSDLPELWNRHIEDSLQLWDLKPPPENWLDLGSGGGFPALPLAISAKCARHDMPMTCIESDQRKCTFLRVAARELDLNLTVLAQRIENVPAQNAEHLSARALTALPDLLAFADRHMAPNGTAVFPKGATWQNEVTEARKMWHFSLEIHPSLTSPDARILICSEITRA